MFGEFTVLKHLAEKVWQMNRSPKGLLIVTTNFDGFSLANRRRIAKLVKLSTHQTFLLYGIMQLLVDVKFLKLTSDQ